MRVAVCLLAVLLLGGCKPLYEAPRVGPVQLHAMQQAAGGVVLVDVRSPEEFAKQHLLGALNFPEGTLEKAAATLDGRHWIAFYCTCPNEHASAKAARTLHDFHGFQKLLVLKGGMQGWIKAGFPTDGPAKLGP